MKTPFDALIDNFDKNDNRKITRRGLYRFLKKIGNIVNKSVTNADLPSEQTD